MKITDLKEVYNEFKYFKGIYTKLNLSESIQFLGDQNDDSVHVIFVRNSSFSNLYGNIKGDTKFLSWLKDGEKSIHLQTEKIIELGKTLKKNVIEIEFDDEKFQFKYLDKDGKTIELTIKKDTTAENKIIKDAFSNIKVDFDNSFELLDEYLKTDIIEVFNDNENISRIRTRDKIIEVPKDRVDSIIKGEKVFISFSLKDEIGSRLVSLKSKSEDLGLELVEIFKTI